MNQSCKKSEVLSSTFEMQTPKWKNRFGMPAPLDVKKNGNELFCRIFPELVSTALWWRDLLSNVVILLFLLIQLQLDGEATSFVFSMHPQESRWWFRLSDEDCGAPYGSSILWRLVSCLYSIDFILYPSVFYIAHICFFPESAYTVCEHSTGYGIATQEGFEDHGNWCYVTYM